MSERIDPRRVVIDLQRLNDVLHGFLMKFAPQPVAAEADTSIDWEDGEIPDQTEADERG